MVDMVGSEFCGSGARDRISEEYGRISDFCINLENAGSKIKIRRKK